jgi:hypothetical protein
VKNFIFIAIILLVISIFILFMQKLQPGDETAAIIHRAFETTGADIVSTEVYFRGELAHESFQEEDMRQRLSKEIISGSGGDVSGILPVFQSIDNDISTGTEIGYIIDDNRRIHISILKDVQGDPAEGYRLSVSLVDTSGNRAAARSASRIADILEHYGVEPEVNISIIGSLEGQLSEKEVEELCGRAFDSISADKVEGINDDGLISISAFSPSISEAIRVNGRRVNVNMASRYNSFEGKTYIWLATPVIMTEY